MYTFKKNQMKILQKHTQNICQLYQSTLNMRYILFCNGSLIGTEMILAAILKYKFIDRAF